ncbi:MAG: transglycosylase SLT domain-containing protein [Rubellimicrobium sp.]|nr:transglycosylase SLT domain-containing protein [Rubellimicrobium sp.]
MRLALALVTLVLVLAAGASSAATDTVCADAARNAARRTGVPVDVLLAIAQVESGRRQSGGVTPWPWTINDSGAGHWYASRDQAETAARAIIAAGRTSFDVGCFQLNYRWHGDAFASVTAMFDPDANALYAAGFLRALHAETGDWSAAAGAYHSRTPVHAQRYRDRFDRALAALGGDPGAPAGPQQPGQAVRVNWFPLLQPGDGAGAAGSLVPLGL